MKNAKIFMALTAVLLVGNASAEWASVDILSEIVAGKIFKIGWENYQDFLNDIL